MTPPSFGEQDEGAEEKHCHVLGQMANKGFIETNSSGMCLSMLGRCVQDRKAVGSNPVVVERFHHFTLEQGP